MDVRFETVLDLPPAPTPGTIYVVKRGDEVEIVYGSVAATFMHSRRPAVQMLLESKGGLLPADAEFGRYLVTEDIEIDALISGMVADAAPTNEAILPIKLGATTVARFRFLAGQAQAVPEILQPIVPAPSILLFKTPAVQDPTLAGIVGTLGARRT